MTAPISHLPAPISDNAVAAMSESRQRIPGDVVNRATADLPDDQRSAIRRFHAYYIENDLSITEASKLIRLSDSTLSLVLRGKYEADPKNVVSEIESFFELHDKRSSGRKLQFISTRLSRRIWEVCESALEFQRIAFIFGETQVGKSESLEAYQRAHNHGSTIYVRMPTGGALMHFLCQLAQALRISHQQRRDDIRRRIIESFDDRMLLIVDEAHGCIPRAGLTSTAPLQSIEFIREIFDAAKCGVVICATNVFRDAMEKNVAFSKILAQTKRRRLCSLQLPDRPSREDLNIFANAFGLDPSEGKSRELETRVIYSEALGMWLTILRMAAKLATKRKQTLKWPHVHDAYDALLMMQEKSK